MPTSVFQNGNAGMHVHLQSTPEKKRPAPSTMPRTGSTLSSNLHQSKQQRHFENSEGTFPTGHSEVQLGRQRQQLRAESAKEHRRNEPLPINEPLGFLSSSARFAKHDLAYKIQRLVNLEFSQFDLNLS